ncbi:sulfatase-like hydrolase/transferase, partial [bacterium]|nr:sulfatase-like hydrolase/transferase [bacterium]
YPPEFERFTPAMPENTDVLSLDPTPEAIEGITNRYKNSLFFLDDALDGFFRKVDSFGLATNTFFLIVGDHGESLGDAGFFAHATGPHIDQFHVPCIILGSGIQPQTIDGLTQHVDVIPTLGSLMGFTAGNLVGENAQTASRGAVLNFDFSSENRVIVRSNDHMSLFDVGSNGRPSWVLTMQNNFSLDRSLYQAYLSTGSTYLAGLVREDFGQLSNLFGKLNEN